MRCALSVEGGIPKSSPTSFIFLPFSTAAIADVRASVDQFPFFFKIFYMCLPCLCCVCLLLVGAVTSVGEGALAVPWGGLWRVRKGICMELHLPTASL